MRESQGQGVGCAARRLLQIAAIQTYEGPAVPDCLVLHLCELAANPTPFLPSCQQGQFLSVGLCALHNYIHTTLKIRSSVSVLYLKL